MNIPNSWPLFQVFIFLSQCKSKHEKFCADIQWIWKIASNQKGVNVKTLLQMKWLVAWRVDERGHDPQNILKLFYTHLLIQSLVGKVWFSKKEKEKKGEKKEKKKKRKKMGCLAKFDLSFKKKKMKYDYCGCYLCLTKLYTKSICSTIRLLLWLYLYIELYILLLRTYQNSIWELKCRI